MTQAADDSQTQRLTIDDVSCRTGESAERLSEWQALGLVGARESDSFAPRDVARVEIIRDLLRLGVTVEAIAEAAGKEDPEFQRYLDWCEFDVGQPLYSIGHVAEVTGLELEQLRRLMEAMGLYGRDDALTDDDVSALQCGRIALEAGYPEDGLLQLLRVFFDALGRAAEATARTTHFYMSDRMKTSGVSDSEVEAKMDAAEGSLNPLLEPTILYFLRRGLTRASRDDALMHLAEKFGVQKQGEAPGQFDAAIVFVDLSSFSPLTEAMGDVKASEVLQRFSSLVRRAADVHHGRVIKQIGDAFMLVFSDVPSAIVCSLEIESRTEDEPQFPAVRSGIHWGAVLYREGDYVGTTVNLASRLTDVAARHAVVVTSAVRQAAAGLPGVEFVRLGKRSLKGIVAEEVLFEARIEGPQGVDRVIDPVCGMELGPGEVVATLALEGEARSFCTDDCLRKFVAAPERYQSLHGALAEGDHEPATS